MTPRTNDSAYLTSGTSPTPPDSKSFSSTFSATPVVPAPPPQTSTAFGARAIVGRRRGSAIARIDSADHPETAQVAPEVAPESEEIAQPNQVDENTVEQMPSKPIAEIFLDFALKEVPAVGSRQQAVNKFRQLINDVVVSNGAFQLDYSATKCNSFLFYVLKIVNDLRTTGCERVCFNKQQPHDVTIQLADWNKFLSIQVQGAPMELYLRMHPSVMITRLKASISATCNSVPLWHMVISSDADKWSYSSNFWLESSWNREFYDVFQMFVDFINETPNHARGVCLERNAFEGIVEDLDELERQGWIHLLGSEFDDGSPRLVGLSLPGYAALWRQSVDRRIHAFASLTSIVTSPIGNCCTTTADIDGRQWLCIADILRMSDEDESMGIRPFGLFAFADGFTFQPQWVLTEQFSLRVADRSDGDEAPDVSITCNSQRCAKRRRLQAITELLNQVPPGTPTDTPVQFELARFMSDAFASYRRFSAANNREDVIRKLPFSFQVCFL